ncbi:MAG: PspC domain-containing protein [Dehalococcoidia bacterium]
MSQQPPAGRRRLTKSHDRKLGGVAGGLADYFDTDPTLIRVLLVVGLFIPGLGLGVVVAYVLLWFIMPDAEGAPPPPRSDDGAGPDATLILGIIILTLGLLALMRTSWMWTSWFGWAGAGLIWPAVLIGIGAYVIYQSRSRA